MLKISIWAYRTELLPVVSEGGTYGALQLFDDSVLRKYLNLKGMKLVGC
jgi:hypothetical protein